MHDRRTFPAHPSCTPGITIMSKKKISRASHRNTQDDVDGKAQSTAKGTHTLTGRYIEANHIELKTIETRLNGIREATKRSRYVFILMTIAAAAILITLWNASLSWDSGIASLHESPKAKTGDQARGTSSSEPSPAGASEEQAKTSDPLRQTIVTEWMRNQLISIGILGIRIHGTDLAVIGSVGLIVIMTWYFYSQRRENRAIVKLLRHCIKEYKAGRIGRDVCSMVFHGIIDSTVFLDVIKGDAPLRGLRDEDTEKNNDKDSGEYTSGVNKRSTTPSFLKVMVVSLVRAILRLASIKTVLRVLVYLPPLTIMAVIWSDVASLTKPSPIRPSGVPLWYALTDDERLKVKVFETVACLSVVYTSYLCWRSTRFSKATTDTLQSYMKFLRNPDQLDELLKEERRRA